MNAGYYNRIIMHLNQISPGLLAIVLAACVPAAAQLSPTEPDALARIRDAAKSNVQACSATGESLCEQVAPKIVANAEGDSPLAGNLQRLTEEVKRQTVKAPSFAWAIEAFHQASVDVHVERYNTPASGHGWVSHEGEAVVVEIRGREKPDEWVLLGAHLDASAPSWDQAYNAALMIEAA